LTLFACPKGYRGTGNLQFTIYVPLVPKVHHIKFERNWSSGYQEEVKNVQMLTDTIYNVWPRPGDKTSTPRIMKFTILVETVLLSITMHLVFLTYMQFQVRIFF
jgi:hypothetical protein